MYCIFLHTDVRGRVLLCSDRFFVSANSNLAAALAAIKNVNFDNWNRFMFVFAFVALKKGAIVFLGGGCARTHTRAARARHTLDGAVRYGVLPILGPTGYNSC
jgi:hypothetical protein